MKNYKRYNCKKKYLVNKERNLLNFAKYLTTYIDNVWLVNNNISKRYEIKPDCQIILPMDFKYDLNSSKDLISIYKGDGFKLLIEISKLKKLEDNLFDSKICSDISDENLSKLFENAFK